MIETRHKSFVEKKQLNRVLWVLDRNEPRAPTAIANTPGKKPVE